MTRSLVQDNVQYLANKAWDDTVGAPTTEIVGTPDGANVYKLAVTSGGAMKVTQSGATSGGLSVYSGSIQAAATAVKVAAGQLYGWYVTNPNSLVSYVQFFDLATGSVTLGTTTPKFSIGIPANGAANVAWPVGIAFTTAITVACTTTRTGLTAPTNSVDLNFFYQ